jgi:hypothetical protein
MRVNCASCGNALQIWNTKTPSCANSCSPSLPSQLVTDTETRLIGLLLGRSPAMVRRDAILELIFPEGVAKGSVSVYVYKLNSLLRQRGVIDTDSAAILRRLAKADPLPNVIGRQK